MQNTVIKKFYSDFSESEASYLNDILEEMRELEVEIPPHVVQRMVQRGIIPSDEGTDIPLVIDDNEEITIPGVDLAIEAWDSGKLYEFSTEGQGHTVNPFRLVLAHEFEEITMFVKVAPQRGAAFTKILDVWVRHGKIPRMPSPHALKDFIQDWDIITALDIFFNNATRIMAS